MLLRSKASISASKVGLKTFKGGTGNRKSVVANKTFSDQPLGAFSMLRGLVPSSTILKASFSSNASIAACSFAKWSRSWASLRRTKNFLRISLRAAASSASSFLFWRRGLGLGLSA